ncbi:NDR1/HIN1-like protein 1 [Magnolia sinica]|uniref:NDR1/HIN1-like protein 1 n=1 Tax=Magnolia sinica TaxID=86752 RepID=UPI002657AF27|nr:NDR1/HIN1-like protein 1 [Magnolia sinica]
MAYLWWSPPVQGLGLKDNEARPPGFYVKTTLQRPNSILSSKCRNRFSSSWLFPPSFSHHHHLHHHPTSLFENTFSSFFLSLPYKNLLPSPSMAEENQTQTKMTGDNKTQHPKTKDMAPMYSPSDTRRIICAALGILFLLAGVTTLVLWLVYRPSKPHFNVVGAAIYDMNTTSTSMISTTMQFTITVSNPNKRTSAYYDRLTAFVSYRNQAITTPVPLPTLYQEPESTVALSPMMGGVMVPVSREVSGGLTVDEAYGVMGLRLVVLGRVRWKAGPFKSGHYGMYVKCDMLVGLKKGFVGQVPLLGSPDCSVDL